MEIIKVADCGFCFGIRRALELAEQAAERYGGVETLGPLLHNPQELARLAPRISPIDRLEQAKGPAIVIRSHGVSPELLRAAEQQGLQIIDATCPFVAKAQRLAEQASGQQRQVVIIGNANHPEVQGLIGWSGGEAAVVSTAEEAEALPHYPAITVIAQTTQTQENFQQCLAELSRHSADVISHNTICDHTQRVQRATAELAAQVDAMLVVGGKNSANTLKLAQISNEAGVATQQVETAAEVDCDIVRSCQRLGISAGASTPQHIIEEVIRRMSDLENKEVFAAEAEETLAAAQVIEETAPEAAAEEQAAIDPVPEDPIAEAAEESVPAGAEAAEEAPAEADATDDSPAEEEIAVEEATAEEVPVEEAPAEPKSELDAFTEEYGDMKEIRRGARVKGVVVQVKDDELLVDIGGKSEGVLTASELSVDDAKHIHERFAVGDEIDVLILRRENQEGYPVLSKRRVDQDIAWDKLAQLKQDKAVVSGTVTDVVKGGVLVDVGLRGFVPASLVSMGYVEDLNSYVGKELQMKIIECDKHSNKLVLSAKAVLRNASKAQKEKTWAEIAEGQTRHGVVRRLTGFGAFVDIGGVDGLLHVSEMAWYRVNHPADLLKEGDELDVFILGVDAENEKISLGLKQLIANPWSLVEEKYPEGSSLVAKVMRITTFGAFLEVEPGVEGLVHISQMAHHRVEKTEDVVRPGDMVEVRVLSVDPEAKRMSLSIKATLPEEEEAPLEVVDAPIEEPAEEEIPPIEEPLAEVPAEDIPVEEEAAEEEAPVEESPAE